MFAEKYYANMMKGFNLGDLHIELPIVQGGMGVGISLSGLASAVANVGGVGTISAVGIGMLEPNYRKDFRNCNKIALRKEIKKSKSKTSGVLAVNIMLAVSDFDDLLQIALEENIDIVFMGAGLPLHLPKNLSLDYLQHSKTKFVPKVSSAKAARLIFDYWLKKYGRVPDGIAIEGPESGGHQGFKRKELENSHHNLINIICQTKLVIQYFEQKTGREIPIIAAGGIYSGSEVYDVLQCGASAVKMGSRFVTTLECDASIAFKENYIRSSKDDITIIDSPVGLPARVISNNFVKQIQNGEHKPVNCPWKCLKSCNYKSVQFCIAEALFNSAQGKLDEGFSFASTKAYLANKIDSVKNTIYEIIFEYNKSLLYSTTNKNLSA